MAVTAGAPAHMWFVKIGGEVWGPYPEARIAEFAREGRVRAATLLSPFRQGPWAPAADSPEFESHIRPREPAPPPVKTFERGQAASEGLHKPKPAPAPMASSHPAVAPAGPARPMLVFAQLASVAPASFQAALARLGSCVQVRADLWLVRSTLGAAALRNQLSGRLGAGDSLLVVEAPLEHAAWFNLAPAQDRELRRVWGGG